MTRNPILALLAIVLLGLQVAGCTKHEDPVPPEPQAAQQEPQAAHAMATGNSVASLAGDGAEIHFKVYGSGQPTVVFVHGWSCDSRYWDAQLDAFAAQYTVVTLDLAGHGQSTRGARKDWSIAEYGADVAAVVEAIGAPRVVLIGHSLGGPVILDAARRLPGKVIGLVGVDTFQDIVTPFPSAELDEFLKPFRADFASATRAFVGDNFFTAASDPVIRQWIIDDMSQAPPEVAIPSLVGLVQMAMSADPRENEEKAASRVEEAARRGAEVVCLPELYRSPYFCQKEDAALFKGIGHHQRVMCV